MNMMMMSAIRRGMAGDPYDNEFGESFAAPLGMYRRAGMGALGEDKPAVIFAPFGTLRRQDFGSLVGDYYKDNATGRLYRYAELQQYVGGGSAASAGRVVGNLATLAPRATTASGGGSYVVVSGDSLSKIANKFKAQGVNVTWQQIASANGIGSPYTIRVGDRLTIPGASGGASNTPAPVNAPANSSGGVLAGTRVSFTGETSGFHFYWPQTQLDRMKRELEARGFTNVRTYASGVTVTAEATLTTNKVRLEGADNSVERDFINAAAIASGYGPQDIKNTTIQVISAANSNDSRIPNNDTGGERGGDDKKDKSFFDEISDALSIKPQTAVTLTLAAFIFVPMLWKKR